MKWYQKKTVKTKDIGLLTEVYNEKYGNYDYNHDSRYLDMDFKDKLLDSVGDLSGLHILVCGSNSGYEINILSRHYPTAIFTALDISNEALEKLKNILPQVKCVHGNMEELPLGDKSFDVYINCRAIHSTNVDMQKSLEEAVRVTKSKLIISIANGYLVDGKIVNGMFDYDTGIIDSRKPKLIAKYIKSFLLARGYGVDQTESGAEIFIDTGL